MFRLFGLGMQVALAVFCQARSYLGDGGRKVVFLGVAFLEVEGGDDKARPVGGGADGERPSVVYPGACVCGFEVTKKGGGGEVLLE